MKIALDLALKGGNRVSPNPKVGCVIVKNNKIIGRGYHEYFGGPHAEVNAIAAAGTAAGATMYVNLEPCRHFGKTPPCTRAILEAGIKEVIVAARDPFPKMRGRSIDMLREKGVKVKTGILEKEAKILNEAYMKFIKKRRPFVILKSALTLDGKIATAAGRYKWITCRKSRELVHRLRGQVDAVLVGINTVINDNPALTAHGKGNNPARIVLDSGLRIPLDSKVLDGRCRTFIATCSRDRERDDCLKRKNVEIIRTGCVKGRVNLPELFRKLPEMSITSVLVEGGSGVNAGLLEAGLVDKVMFFISPKIFGGKEALTPVGGKGVSEVGKAINVKSMRMEKTGNDFLLEGYIRKKTA